MAEPMKQSAMKYSIPAGDSNRKKIGMIPRIIDGTDCLGV